MHKVKLSKNGLNQEEFKTIPENHNNFANFLNLIELICKTYLIFRKRNLSGKNKKIMLR